MKTRFESTSRSLAAKREFLSIVWEGSLHVSLGVWLRCLWGIFFWFQFWAGLTDQVVYQSVSCCARIRKLFSNFHFNFSIHSQMLSYTSAATSHASFYFSVIFVTLFLKTKHSQSFLILTALSSILLWLRLPRSFHHLHSSSFLKPSFDTVPILMFLPDQVPFEIQLTNGDAVKFYRLWFSSPQFVSKLVSPPTRAARFYYASGELLIRSWHESGVL